MSVQEINHSKWHEEQANKVGKIFETNPSKISALFVGAAFAGIYIAIPARYTFDFLKRSVVQLSLSDFGKAVLGIMLTLLFVVISPIVFVGVSIMMFTDIEGQKERNQIQNKLR